MVSNDELKRMWDETERTGEPVMIGDIVVCDICDRDCTDSPDVGGFIFISKAYCPVCARDRLPSIQGFGEEHYIRAWCPENTAFADFVRQYRGAGAIIQISKSHK